MHAQNSTKVYPDFSGKWIVNSKIENPIGIDSLLNTVEGDTLQSIIIPVKDNRRSATSIKSIFDYSGKKTSEFAELLGEDISYLVSWKNELMIISNSLGEAQEWSLSADKKQLNIKFIGSLGESFIYIFDKVK